MYRGIGQREDACTLPIYLTHELYHDTGSLFQCHISVNKRPIRPIFKKKTSGLPSTVRPIGVIPKLIQSSKIIK